MSFAQGAYAEPVAASLAVLKVGLRPEQRVAIYGTGRIAELTRRVLATEGIHAPLLSDADLDDQRDLDALVETGLRPASMPRLAQALRPGGTLVLKSRSLEPVTLRLVDLLPRELVLRMVHYGSFTEGLALLASGRLVVDDLCGEPLPLDAWEAAFARDDERLKTMFRPGVEG